MVKGSELLGKLFCRINRESERVCRKVEATAYLLFKGRRKTIYLFGCPIHSNMGDQAQTYCIVQWLKNNYDNYKILELSRDVSSAFFLKLLRRTIGKEDLLFGHSGYHFIDHHEDLPVYRTIVQLFPDYKIVIFPQTVNIKREEVLERTAKALNSHSGVTLLCRDEVSFEKAQKIFKKCKLLLYPDIVTTLIGKKQFASKREGVLFCMRNDTEAYYKTSEIAQLMARVREITLVELTDTTIPIPYSEIKSNKEKILEEAIEKFAHYKVIITDRYHGVIFSLVAATPVIVLTSSDHKLSSGVKWFPESFCGYVKYANDLAEAYNLTMKMLGDNYEYKLPPYFQDNYYSTLKEKLK